VSRAVADHLADECRASPDGRQKGSSDACDNFLYSFKGAPSARQRRAPARLQRRKARAGRERKRNLRRAAPPGRWRRGRSGDCPRLGRRRSRGLSRAGALPSPRRRRRAAVPATAGPVVTHRYATPGIAPCATGRDPSPPRGTQSAEKRHRTVPRGLLPSNRRSDCPGGDSGPVKGAPSARRFRDGASGTLDRTWPRVPRAHGACRVEGRSGRSPSVPAERPGKTEYLRCRQGACVRKPQGVNQR